MNGVTIPHRCLTNLTPDVTMSVSTGNDRNSDQKDQCIKELQEQINRLTPLEAITTQKDILIKHLQNQLFQMNQLNRLFHYTDNSTSLYTPRNVSFMNNYTQTDHEQNVITSSSSPSSNRSLYPTQQQQQPRQEQEQQHGPIRVRPCSTPSPMKLSSNNVTMLTNHNDKMNNDTIKDEQLLEKTHKERQILSGLYNKSQDKKQYNLEKEQFEKEIDSIRQKYKTSELHNHSLQDELDKMKLDHHKLLQDVENKLVAENKLRKELEEMQFERLRTRIMRIVFAVISETQFNTKKTLESSSNKKVTINSESNTQSMDDNNHELSNAKSPPPPPPSSSSSSSSIDNVDSYQDINHNEQLLDRIQFLADDYKRLQYELQINNSIDNQMKQQNKTIENELNEFIHVYIEAQQNMKDTPRFRSSLRLKQDIELLAAYVPASEILKRLQRILLDDLQDQVNTQQRLEDCVQEAVGTIQSQNTDMLHIINRPDDLVNTIRHLAELTTIMIQQKTDLLKQIKMNEMEHQEELLKTKSLIQNEWKMMMDDKIAKLNYENADKIQKAVEEVARVESLRQEQLLSVKATIIEELENKLRETRQILAEKQIAHETELNEAKDATELLPRLQQEIELKENQIEEMKSQLDQQNQANIKLHEEIEKQCESRWKSELDSYREQVRQHARTICVMEERLVKLTKQLKDTKNEVTKFKRTNTDLQSENKQLQTRLTDAHNRLQSLRTKTSAHQTSTIEVLRSDLQGTQAQLSDIKGELPEIQKEEIENALNDNKKINQELCNTKTQLVNLKDSLEQMNEKLYEKDEHIKRLQITIQELTNSKHEYEYKIKHLQETINDEREKLAHHHHNEPINASSKLTQELMNLGNECKGERHHEIIDKQREALSNTESDELILQISKLKRENAELRSKALLAEVVPSIKALTNNSTLALSDVKNGDDDQVTGQKSPNMDHIGLRNAMDALYTSEECYLNLARSISSRLDLDRLPGQRSLIQVPKIERETVRKERQNTIELLSQRIEILKNQLQHKENLLSEYERDMSRLKQAEALADAKGEQLDQFINELRSKETEIQLLRQSLDRTREALLNEQRSVAAFKKSREQRQRKAIQEKLKRKDYEIDTLKNQLEERDKKLQLLSDQTMKMRIQMVMFKV
uniref:Forkhead-associated domain-containing protein 1 n=1 Tax=Schistosoma haematobium TaxID=6185 RepID=A0A095A2W1_SCHHA